MYLLGSQQIKFKDCGAPVPAFFLKKKALIPGGGKLGILQSTSKQTQPSRAHGNKDDNQEEGH